MITSTKPNQRNKTDLSVIKSELDTNWYVLYTCPRAEKVAYQELFKREYEVFLPLLKSLRVWKNRQKKNIFTPLFPNYIFVKTYEHELYNIIRLPKIVTYLRNGEKPSVISPKEVSVIQKMLSAEQNISVNHEFLKGDKVKIVCGPLAGFEGELIEKKGKYIFVVNIKEINHSISVNIEASLLERVRCTVFSALTTLLADFFLFQDVLMQ